MAKKSLRNPLSTTGGRHAETEFLLQKAGAAAPLLLFVRMASAFGSQAGRAKTEMACCWGCAEKVPTTAWCMLEAFSSFVRKDSS